MNERQDREHKRNWHRRRLDGKLRERSRREDSLDGYYLQFPTTSDINGLGHLTTETLRSRLEGVGLGDPWMLDRSNIYERAIINLGIILDKAPLPSFLREAASLEIALLANSLLTLFTGGVRLHATELTDVNAIFSGYFEYFDGQTKRVSIEQRLKEAYQPQSRRAVSPNCQILVREIMGRSSRGGAIAGSDLTVRCGLRFGGRISDNKWRVSINSGIPASEGNQEKSIGPITQAYNESSKCTDTIDTFHFEDPDTKTAYPGESASQFSTFNRYLNLVFRELARA